MADPEEIEWVRKAMDGDRPSFERIVRTTGRLVFASLYLETGDPHRADDLTQETFLLAWRNRGQLADPAGLRAWLLRIAQRAMLDSVKHEQRKKRNGSFENTPLTLLPNQDDEPVDLVGRAESRKKALDALRELPEQYRLPLSLRYLTGCDYAAIGKQLGLSNGALQGLLHRGLKLLRERLGEG